MALTRADLEKDLLREAFRRAHPGIPVLSDADQEASLRRVLEEHPAGADVWIFGYGSLVWNPLVHHEERRVARLHGFHRSFCLWSHVNRGSMQKPGLVLGLDTGGSCRGVAFRVAHDKVPAELRLLWRREMVLGVLDDSSSEHVPPHVQVPAQLGRVPRALIADTARFPVYEPV